MIKNSKTKIVFMGTPQFAVPSLIALHQDPSFKIVLVVSEPDKPSKRNMQIQKPAINKLSMKLGLEVFQPESLKNQEVIKKILSYKSDIIITVAYGQFLPKELLNKTINVHPSLLPKYRGPSPIQSAILNGDKKTGISIMLSDKKIDHGPLLAQKEIKIDNLDTYKSLSEKLARTGTKFLLETIKQYLSVGIKPKTQNHTQASICKLIKKQDGELDFQKQAEILEREIRAYFPWPGSFFETKINNKKRLVKILEAKVQKKLNQKIKIGILYSPNKKDLFINCEKDTLEISKLQIEGKNSISAQDFINGYLKK
ncbi:MAG: methionyl-tRNA formyltransferase [bacterium]